MLVYQRVTMNNRETYIGNMMRVMVNINGITGIYFNGK